MNANNSVICASVEENDKAVSVLQVCSSKGDAQKEEAAIFFMSSAIPEMNFLMLTMTEFV
jgi:hypothetical protein